LKNGKSRAQYSALFCSACVKDSGILEMILFQCFKLSQGEFYFTGGNLKIVCAESQTLNYAVVRQITENSFKARNFVEFTFSYHSDVFGVDVTFAGFKSFFLPTIMDTPAAPFFPFFAKMTWVFCSDERCQCYKTFYLVDSK
jgi:hypothetical protein